ncbi:MAG: hypothetical protein WAQ05_24600, partial [Rubrivivax sp.]
MALFRPCPQFARRLSHGLVWLLLVALPLYGNTGALLKLLGPAHRHNTPAVDTRLLSALGSGAAAVLGVLRGQAHVHGPGSRPHNHGVFERHRHAPGDSSVVTADASDSALATMGSVLLVFAMPPAAAPGPGPA